MTQCLYHFQFVYVSRSDGEREREEWVLIKQNVMLSVLMF